MLVRGKHNFQIPFLYYSKKYKGRGLINSYDTLVAQWQTLRNVNCRLQGHLRDNIRETVNTYYRYGVLLPIYLENLNVRKCRFTPNLNIEFLIVAKRITELTFKSTIDLFYSFLTLSMF